MKTVGSTSGAGAASTFNKPKSSWSPEVGAWWLHNVLKRICLSWIFIDRCETKVRKNDPTIPSHAWDLSRAIYLLVWTAALLAAWLWNPGPFQFRMFVGLIAAYRAYEIIVSGLGTTLGDLTQTKARNLITIGFYGVQLTLIFAIVYHSFAGGCFQPAVDSTVDSHLASTDYLYISWANFTSLGQNAYEAKSEVAQFLEVSTTSMGILLLAVLLAFGINEVKETRQNAREGPP